MITKKAQDFLVLFLLTITKLIYYSDKCKGKVCMRNRCGVSVSGYFFMNDGTENGSTSTEFLPNVLEPQYVGVGTGEKGFFGREKKKKVQSGSKADNLWR